MADSFKSLFSKIINKDESHIMQPHITQEEQVDDLKNMEIDLDANDIKDNLNIDELDQKQLEREKQVAKVETVILDFEDVNELKIDENSKQTFETVSDEETLDIDIKENAEAPEASKKAKFLIVDDANFMRILMRKILEEEGFEVVGEASNGEEAIQMVKELNPDIVTLDITMPEMDGIIALKEMLLVKPEIKVIMCSAMNQRDIVLDALKMGAKDFISKPFEQNKVAEVIKRVATIK